MSKTIGVLAAEHIAAGVVEDHKLAGTVSVYPRNGDDHGIASMPSHEIAGVIRDGIAAVSELSDVGCVGVGFPGIIRDGVIEESPNLQQVKGLNLQEALTQAIGGRATVRVFNDADVLAAGIAATVGQLDKLVRVWTLGNGIGFGRYPSIEGVWEGGHSVVSLDPKEVYCGCGGQGHLEGIMGNRAMRKRFLDLEPDEIFQNATSGDHRCRDFVRLWHKALAAATATSIHMDGPGKFFLTGMNARYVDLKLLNSDLTALVKMSPLQGSSIQVISTSDEMGIIGAAVNATRARGAAARG